MKIPKLELITLYSKIEKEIHLFTNKLEREIDQIQQNIGKQFKLENKTLNSGKKLRPFLCLFIGKALGKISKAHYQGALACEMIHLASLIHDDIIDNANTRRHRKTTNALLGNKNALLLGDYIFCHGIEIFSQEKEFSLITSSFLKSVKQICYGEIIQNQNPFDTLSTENYLKIIRLKTGSLFGETARISALASKQNKEIQEAFQEFGESIGTAYQIYDDYLDYFKAEKETGKTAGTDAKNGKLTLPLISLLQEANKKEKENYITALKEGNLQEIDKKIQTKNTQQQIAKQIQEILNQGSKKLEKHLPPKHPIWELKNIFQKISK